LPSTATNLLFDVSKPSFQSFLFVRRKRKGNVSMHSKIAALVDNLLKASLLAVENRRLFVAMHLNELCGFPCTLARTLAAHSALMP
jgi:hypothetical protein